MKNKAKLMRFVAGCTRDCSSPTAANIYDQSPPVLASDKEQKGGRLHTKAALRANQSSVISSQ